MTRPTLFSAARAALALGFLYVVARLFTSDAGSGSTLLDYLVIGTSQGAIYAFIALGYTMVYGIIRLINFAHGEIFMAGAFAGYFVLRDGGLERLDLPQPWPVVLAYVAAVLAGALVSGVLAVLAEAFCYRPIRSSGRIAALLTAVGLSLLLQNVARQWPVIGPTQRPWPDPLVWTALADVPSPADAHYYELRTFPASGGGTVQREKLAVAKGATLAPAVRTRLEAVGDRPVYRKGSIEPRTVNRVIVLLLAACTGLLWFLVQRTRMGRAMRAVSEDARRGPAHGREREPRGGGDLLPRGRARRAWAASPTARAYGQVDPLTGFMPGLKAFIAAVLGGIGSIPGAVVGGLLLGVVENLFGAYVSTQWKDALAFVVLVGILLVRPTGLLGKARREKV